MAGGAAVAIAGLCAVPAHAKPDPLKQIAELQAIKKDLSPGERKLDSRMAVALRAKQAVPTEVDIAVRDPQADLLARLQKLGANVRYVSPRTGAIRAQVPAAAMRTVAGWKEVSRIDPAGQAITAHIGPITTTEEERAERVGEQLRAAVVTSEGDRAHAADTARAASKVTGVGVKICALSDGVDSLAASQATGELPPVDILPGKAGSGDEGTAMLEIVHDVAPGADLGFATANPSEAAFADNI